jgi:hypothetical protein
VSLPAQTVARRLASAYWQDRFTAAATGVPEQVDFDRDNPEDVAPFTLQQVRDTVGYVLLRFDEVDRWGGPLAGDDGAGNRTRYFFTLENLEFEIRTPTGADAVLEESYAETIETLFTGVTLRHDEDPLVVLRNHGEHPVRRRAGSDDGSFRQLYLDVKLERRERRVLAGAQEVTL